MSEWIQVTEWSTDKKTLEFATPLLGKVNVDWKYREHPKGGKWAVFKDTKRACIGGDAGSGAK